MSDLFFFFFFLTEVKDVPSTMVEYSTSVLGSIAALQCSNCIADCTLYINCDHILLHIIAICLSTTPAELHELNIESRPYYGRESIDL